MQALKYITLLKTGCIQFLTAFHKGNFKNGGIEQEVGDFYASGMDSATINKLGYEPIKPVLAQIGSLKSTNDIMQFVAQQKVQENNL